MKIALLIVATILALASGAKAQFAAALSARDTAALGEMPEGSAQRFTWLTSKETIEAARAMDVRISPAAASALQKYFIEGPVAARIVSPPPRGLSAAQLANNRHQFVLLLLSNADGTPSGKILTPASITRTNQLITTGLRDWFCPCWPFCD